MTRDDPIRGLSPELLRKRREAVFEALGRGVMVLPSAPAQKRSRDTEHPYRPDSELFYVTGATEAGTVAVLVGGAEPRYVLFVHERDPDVELWTGPRLGPAGAAERYGATEAYPLAELERLLPELLQEGDRVHFRTGRKDDVERMVMEAFTRARARGARRGTGPRALVDPGEILDEMRLVKDGVEIQRIRRAAEVTLAGHRAALARVAPGVGEWTLQAAMEAAFLEGGASGPGYGTIVGSGPNACFLHYVDNRRPLDHGDMVLMDAGAEVDLYNGDVTRTVPASGRFNDLQRAVYDIVDGARAAAVAATRPGASIADVHDAAVAVLVEGLVSLGILSGSVEDLVAQGAYKSFYPHQTSHWIGLDVHDPGDYARGGASRILEPGMVFTVEPGLYFRPGIGGAAVDFEGIGVRIEDDVLVTASGYENLTEGLPTAAADMEALLGGGIRRRWRAPVLETSGVAEFEHRRPRVCAEFYKAHGLGNDYLVFEEGDAWTATPEAVGRVCDRWRGPGGDGIVVLLAGGPGHPGQADDGTFRLRMFNPDGSEFERSGNGLRILASHLARRARVDTLPFTVEVGGDQVRMTVHHSAPPVHDVSVDMGRARVGPAAVALDPAALDAGGCLEVAGGERVLVTPVSVGNPHLVVFTDADTRGRWDLLMRQGDALATHPALARGANVQVASVVSPGACHAFIWERGVGHTSASGTSSCAVAVAAVSRGLLEPGEIIVHQEGGDLKVTVTPDLDVVLRGSVAEVSEGVLTPGFVASLGG